MPLLYAAALKVPLLYVVAVGRTSAVIHCLKPIHYTQHMPSVCAVLCAGMSYKTHAGATKGPAPEDFEIRTNSQLQSSCYDKPGLCLVTLLDGRSDLANKHRW